MKRVELSFLYEPQAFDAEMVEYTIVGLIVHMHNQDLIDIDTSEKFPLTINTLEV